MIYYAVNLKIKNNFTNLLKLISLLLFIVGTGIHPSVIIFLSFILIAFLSKYLIASIIKMKLNKRKLKYLILFIFFSFIFFFTSDSFSISNNILFRLVNTLSDPNLNDPTNLIIITEFIE